MSEEADFKIDLITKGFSEEESTPTTRERNLRRTFGYKELLIQPSEEIGTGSYGSVIKAKLDNLPCAAKLLHRTFFTSHDPHMVDFIRRFKQECRILRQLKHPCIVQFLGVLEDPRPRSNRRPILLMELMEQSLTHFLESRQRDLPYHVQVSIMHDITLALDYLHSNGILHRDLSSNNILLSAGSRAKLTDFGMSKMVDLNPRMSRNKQTECPGTLAYMPPEALVKAPDYSDKIDVFSTGVLIVQIITRKFPKPTDPHRRVRDPNYKGKILIPVPELERRENDLRGVFMTHPLRAMALECLKDDDEERPTAANLCRRLTGMLSTPEYADSKSQYNEQLVALLPTSLALAMRDTEIAVLDEQIEALSQEKRRLSRGIFWKKSEGMLDEEISELCSKKEPLVSDKLNEEEERRKKVEYEHKNDRLKGRVEKLEAEVEEMEGERERLDAKEAQEKIAELKQIIQTHLEQRSVQQESVAKEGESEIGRQTVKKKRWVSLPSLKLGDYQDERVLVAQQRMFGAKALRLSLSEVYQNLNAQSILQEMVEGKLIQPQNKRDAEAYSSEYAQNISAGVALFHGQGPATFLLALCSILESRDSPKQRKLAMTLRSEHDKVCSKVKQKVLERFHPSLPTTPPSEMNVADLQSQFLQTLQTVMDAFEQLPDSLSHLKQFFSQLVLPMGEGKVVPLVSSSTYENATTTKEVFRRQSSLLNCFSPHLLKMMSEECQCPMATAAVEQFIQFRSTHASSLICRRIKLIQKQGNAASSLHPSHLAYHTGPLANLQSLHPSVWECLDEHKNSEPLETVRVTVQVDRRHITLQDYDDFTTAVCGYFNLPNPALAYAGCSDDGQVICWTTSASLLPYLESITPGMSSYRLMAEQKILGVAAGDLHYHCMSLKEVELSEAVFYGLTRRVQSLMSQNVSLNFRDKDGATPLYIASWRGHGAVVKLLLEQHADVSISKTNGWTPLMTASFEGHADIVQTLIEAKAQVDTQQEDGWTALHMAAQEGKVNVVRLLLTEAQALVNIQTKDGRTPLYIASGKGHGAVVKLLLEQHADVSISKTYGWTPLMAASFEGHADIVQTLIEAKAQVDTQEEDGWTALHMAAQEGKFDVVRLLLTEAQALVNIQTKDGVSPLFIASQNGHKDAVNILLRNGADVNLRFKGTRPIDIARSQGHTDIVNLLQQKK